MTPRITNGHAKSNPRNMKEISRIEIKTFNIFGETSLTSKCLE
jgi:hypothetical protein